jgi:hypothetical protein
VREVRTASSVSTVTLPVASSTSANTGVAPTYRTAFAVAMNDSEGTITSSPGPTPTASMARCRPVVQELTAMPCAAPTRAANVSSNVATRGPCATQPERTASAAACASSSPSNGSITAILRCGVASTVMPAPPSGRCGHAADPLAPRAHRLCCAD